MQYFTSLTLEKTTCPRCGTEGNLVVSIYRSDNKTSHKLLIRHTQRRRNPEYCYIATVTVPHIKEIFKYNDKILCTIHMANISGAKKIEITDDQEIKLYYPRYTITVNYDETLNLVGKTIQYNIESPPPQLYNIVDMLAEMITSCFKTFYSL